MQIQGIPFGLRRQVEAPNVRQPSNLPESHLMKRSALCCLLGPWVLHLGTQFKTQVRLLRPRSAGVLLAPCEEAISTWSGTTMAAAGMSGDRVNLPVHRWQALLLEVVIGL